MGFNSVTEFLLAVLFSILLFISTVICKPYVSCNAGKLCYIFDFSVQVTLRSLIKQKFYWETLNQKVNFTAN